MDTKVIAFTSVVFLIVAVLLFSGSDGVKYCEDTTKAVTEYESEIKLNLDNGDWQQAVRNYDEFENCFGEDKSSINAITDYLSNAFSTKLEEKKYGEILNDYKYVTEHTDNDLFESKLGSYVFESYESSLKPYGELIQGANFVLNTSTQIPACSAYLTIYEDMKKEISKDELFDIEKNVQLCYVLEANKYRYKLKRTTDDVNSAVTNYEKAIFLNIQNPVYNHAVKIADQLKTCSKQQGTCVSEQIKGECNLINGPSSGFIDCGIKEVCCESFG